MKRRLLIILGVALAAATASTVIFYKLVSGNLAKKPTAGAEQHSIVVAVRDLPRGSQLRPEDFKQVPWEGGPLPGGTYTDSNSLGGRLLQLPVRQGEPVLESQLASGKDPTAAAVPPGLRAVSVHVEEYAGVTEILEPGDRVDVLVANGPRQPGNPTLNMKTSLENIEVFSTGRPAEGVRTRANPTVTLLVRADDAEALTLADHRGAVRLVLRNPLDESTLGAPGGVLSDSVGSSRAKPAGQALGSRKKAGFQAGAAEAVRAVYNGNSRLPVRPAAAASEQSRAATALAAPDQIGNHQVLLEVRFASMGDQALKDLTSALAQSYTAAPVILSSFPPGWDADQAVNNLARQQRLQVFAEPRILALDSTAAELAKNSAVPLEDAPGSPARPDGALQLDLDRVGIKVSFVPRVTRPGVIRMRVRSEVTDPTHTVRLAGMDLPRVSWLSSECELELLDRQSFWIRSLIDRPEAHDLLRQLFPRERLQHDLNDELVVLVTPRLLQHASREFSALQR